jgi:predicted RNase H-like HicB family nuclease
MDPSPDHNPEYALVAFEPGYQPLYRVVDSSRRSCPMKLELTAVFEQVPEGYVAYVEELPGANTQGKTLDEARANLAEAVELVLEANRVLAGAWVRDR